MNITVDKEKGSLREMILMFFAGIVTQSLSPGWAFTLILTAWIFSSFKINRVKTL